MKQDPLSTFLNFNLLFSYFFRKDKDTHAVSTRDESTGLTGCERDCDKTSRTHARNKRRTTGRFGGMNVKPVKNGSGSSGIEYNDDFFQGL